MKTPTLLDKHASLRFVDLWRDAGFTAIKYRTPSYELLTGPIIYHQVKMSVCLLALLIFFHSGRKLDKLRQPFGWLAIALTIAWPFAAGRSGQVNVDYAWAVAVFYITLKLQVAFLCESVSYTMLWSFPETVLNICMFPARPKREVSRLNGFKMLPDLLVKLVAFNIILFFVPRPQDVDKLSTTAYYVHFAITGWAIYCCLSAFSLAATISATFLFGVEQIDILAWPFFAVNLQKYWSIWNRAVKDNFQVISRTLAKNVPGGAATGAASVFLLSGLYHEYANYAATNVANGDEMKFFGLNGLACFALVAVRHANPSLTSWIPSWLGVVFTQAFLTVVCPLFNEVLLRNGFFEAFKANQCLMPVTHFIKLL